MPTVPKLIRKSGVFRVKEAKALGLHPEQVRRLIRLGQLTRLGRGLYAPATAEAGEHHTLAEVAKRVPKGIICLLTALRFHALGTQHPREVWLAVDRRAAIPKLDVAPVRIVRMTGAAMTSGVDEHEIEGVTVRVTSPARTVVDCFKFRNKLGVDVALEALRLARQRKRVQNRELLHYARLLRVEKPMSPYLQAIE
jgi:predicted transcriptional regulator of viral defense system